jgi:hypothetical protein
MISPFSSFRPHVGYGLAPDLRAECPSASCAKGAFCGDLYSSSHIHCGLVYVLEPGSDKVDVREEIIPPKYAPKLVQSSHMDCLPLLGRARTLQQITAFPNGLTIQVFSS